MQPDPPRTALLTRHRAVVLRQARRRQPRAAYTVMNDRLETMQKQAASWQSSAAIREFLWGQARSNDCTKVHLNSGSGGSAADAGAGGENALRRSNEQR